MLFDTELGKKVSDRLMADEELVESGISVVDRSGVITLTGKVPDAAMKKRAGAIASNHDDVKSVINDLKIETDDDKPPRIVMPVSAGRQRIY